MKCKVEYRHPVTGNCYLFVDFRDDNGVLKPVGCFLYRSRLGKATIFETKRDALKVVDYLLSLGYKAYVR